MGALATVPVPTITALVDQTSSGSASTSEQPVTVTGIGALHFSLSSSNPALVPNSVVGAGMPGLTVSSGCGTSTLTCTLAVTPIVGRAGTATLTISVVDGANRSAAAQMTLTATDPAPAPAGGGSSSGSSGSSGTGSTTTSAASGGHSGGAVACRAGPCSASALCWPGRNAARCAPARDRSKVHRDLRHGGKWLQRMHLDIRDARRRFTLQARRVVVSRRIGVGVEQVV